MTFQEKSAWVVVLASVSVLWIFGVPFVRDATPPPFAYGPILVVAVIAFIIVATLGHIALGVLFPKAASAPLDERDRRIELQAERAGGVALGLAAFAGVVFALYEGAPRVAMAIFLGLVVSELVKSATQIWLYRRGA